MAAPTTAPRLVPRPPTQIMTRIEMLVQSAKVEGLRNPACCAKSEPATAMKAELMSQANLL